MVTKTTMLLMAGLLLATALLPGGAAGEAASTGAPQGQGDQASASACPLIVELTCAMVCVGFPEAPICRNDV